MNERIFDMAQQSGATDENGNRAEYVFCFTKDELKGFTELIIKECMELTHWKDFDMSVEQRIRLSVYQDIRKHFGVKE